MMNSGADQWVRFRATSAPLVPLGGLSLSQNELARLLRPFRIKPKEMRIGTTNKNGYSLDQFRGAFHR